MASETVPYSIKHDGENASSTGDIQGGQNNISGHGVKHGEQTPDRGPGIFFITENSIGGSIGQFSISVDRIDIHSEQYSCTDINSNVKSSHENIELNELVNSKNTQCKVSENNNVQDKCSHQDSSNSDIIYHENIDLEPRNPHLDPRHSELDPRHSELDPRHTDLDPRHSDIDPSNAQTIMTTAQDAELIEADQTNAFCEWHQKKAIAIAVTSCITIMFTTLIVTLIVFIMDRQRKSFQLISKLLYHVHDVYYEKKSGGKMASEWHRHPFHR